MNYSKIPLFFIAIALSCTGFASQELEKTDQEQGAYYTVIMPQFKSKDLSEWGSVALYAQKDLLHKQIATADFVYSPCNKQNKKEAYLSNLEIEKKYRNLGLGNYFFKYTMAHIKAALDCEIITWMAYPITDKKFARLVSFYKKAGAIDIDKSKRKNTHMHYPLPSAQMLTVMMPILEPKPLSKHERDMVVFPSGSMYNHSPSDALGIIANFMGEKNEDESSKKMEVL